MRREAGFTLIEVVLALGLLLLGASVILGMLSFGAALSRTAHLRTLSAAAIESVEADLAERLFPLEPDGTAGEPRPIADRPVPGHDELLYSATATPSPAGPLVDGGAVPYRVDVEIRWRGGAGRRSREFSFLLLREVPFGERMRRALAAEEEGAGEEPQPEPGATPDDEPRR